MGRLFKKGDNTWEKGKLICIGAGKNMSKLMRVIGAITTMNKSNRCVLICVVFQKDFKQLTHILTRELYVLFLTYWLLPENFYVVDAVSA